MIALILFDKSILEEKTVNGEFSLSIYDAVRYELCNTSSYFATLRAETFHLFRKFKTKIYLLVIHNRALLLTKEEVPVQRLLGQRDHRRRRRQQQDEATQLHGCKNPMLSASFVKGAVVAGLGNVQHATAKGKNYFFLPAVE